ncbi:ATP-dependent DNA helicase [Trichonephila clavipes]|nr:ATP-dependent DNA helicase [Trichonephila clavipes]
MVNLLPRNVDDDYCVNIHIKRRKIHRTSYLMGLVTKRTIKAWLQYLVATPLYRMYDVTIDDSFFNLNQSTSQVPQDEISENITIDRVLQPSNRCCYGMKRNIFVSLLENPTLPASCLVNLVIEKAVDLTREINLEVDGDEVQELLDSHHQELTNDELIEMHEQDIRLSANRRIFPQKRKGLPASFQAKTCVVPDDVHLASVGNHMPKMVSNYKDVGNVAKRDKKKEPATFVQYGTSPCALQRASYLFTANYPH